MRLSGLQTPHATPELLVVADGHWETSTVVPVTAGRGRLAASLEEVAAAAERDVAVEVLWPGLVFVGVRWGLTELDDAMAGAQRTRESVRTDGPRPVEAAHGAAGIHARPGTRLRRARCGRGLAVGRPAHPVAPRRDPPARGCRAGTGRSSGPHALPAPCGRGVRGDGAALVLDRRAGVQARGGPAPRGPRRPPRRAGPRHHICPVARSTEAGGGTAAGPGRASASTGSPASVIAANIGRDIEGRPR